MSRVAVIGGGPAGMMAAFEAAKNGHDATVFERNEKLGKKLYITGKGRCNITNAAELEDFFANIPRNPRFMYSALYGFSNSDLLEFINGAGVKTKVERGGRVFPESDRSSDIIRAFTRRLSESGAKVELNARVGSVKKDWEGFALAMPEGERRFDALVIATGGMSYPSTGSTGDGYAFAKSLGHSITELRPSLISLETEESWPTELMGLSLKNVTLYVKDARGRKVLEELGEMLFTHFGVSGPLVLSASAAIADKPEGAELTLDLKPGLSVDELDRRILRDFELNIRKRFENSLDALLPRKLIPVIVALSGIGAETPVHQITREQRMELVALLKGLKMKVARAMPIEEAIITRGGVPTKEIDPSTMRSKLVNGLYFAGEIIDVDGYTGGFNLQIACSTGALAGRSIE